MMWLAKDVEDWWTSLSDRQRIGYITMLCRWEKFIKKAVKMWSDNR